MKEFDFLGKFKIDIKVVLVAIFSVILFFYIIDLLFGDRSFSRMIDLDNNLKTLDKKVKALKKENSILQKEYFELKELEGN